MKSRPTIQHARLRNGVVLPYLDPNPRAGTPVVLLHGLSDSCRSFETVMAHLPRDLRPIAPTLRGHAGASLPETYRIADFSEDVVQLLDALKLDRAVIVGHSMGGVVAQRFAADHPDHVAGLVLVDTFARFGRVEALRAFGRESIAALADPVDPAFVRAFQESTLARPLPPPVLDDVVAESLAVPARVWQAAWAALEESDLVDELHRVAAPTLIVWGDRDEMALEGEQETLRRAIPGARRATFMGAGHAPHWEEPVRFARLLAEFARGLGREPAAA